MEPNAWKGFFRSYVLGQWYCYIFNMILKNNNQDLNWYWNALWLSSHSFWKLRNCIQASKWKKSWVGVQVFASDVAAESDHVVIWNSTHIVRSGIAGASWNALNLIRPAQKLWISKAECCTLDHLRSLRRRLAQVEEFAAADDEENKLRIFLDTATCAVIHQKTAVDWFLRKNFVGLLIVLFS